MSIRFHTMKNVRFKDFMRGLLRALARAATRSQSFPGPPLNRSNPWRAKNERRHGQTAVRTPQRLPDPTNGRGRRRRGRAFRGGRSVHPSPHRISGLRLLCIDGLCSPGGDWSANGKSETSPARPGRRRRLPDDRHGTGHERRYGLNPMVDCAEQRRVWHRAPHAGRSLQ